MTPAAKHSTANPAHRTFTRAGAPILLCLLALAGCPSSPPAENPPRTSGESPPQQAPVPAKTERAATDDAETKRAETELAETELAETELAETDANVSESPESVPPRDPRPLEPVERSASTEALDDDATPESAEADAYGGKHPAEIAAERAFSPPADSRRLAPDASLWVDAERGRVIVDGFVTLREGPLEMFACPVGTKEHEAVVAVLARSRYVHAALLAVGAMPGTPVSFMPEYRPATGQRIAIWVMWRDADNQIRKTPAQQWVQNTGTDAPLQTDWVFAGSSFWTDPESRREYYQADAGDLVCVSNFSTATLDLPVESSQSNAALQYSAFTDNIPPRGTPVRLIFIPVPLPADEPQQLEEGKADPKSPPEDALLEPAEDG